VAEDSRRADIAEILRVECAAKEIKKQLIPMAMSLYFVSFDAEGFRRVRSLLMAVR
jgi:hypothetical protein